MTTLRSLDGQQVKWNFGAIDLMWPGQRGDTKGQPFHPNLRLRWVREPRHGDQHLHPAWLRACCWPAALSHPRLRVHPLWLIPPAVAVLLNVRLAHGDEEPELASTSSSPPWPAAELYMWLRMGHFVRAWAKFLSRVKTDNWAEQAKAEKG